MTYDMMSYVHVAIGCLFPLLFLPIIAMDIDVGSFFPLLLTPFFVVFIAENSLIPLETVRLWVTGDAKRARHLLRTMIITSLYSGAIATEIFSAVLSAVLPGSQVIQVTPKRRYRAQGLINVLRRNKLCYGLGAANAFVVVQVAPFSPGMALLLALSPICYLVVPMIDLTQDHRGDEMSVNGRAVGSVHDINCDIARSGRS